MSSQLVWSEFPIEDRIRFIAHKGKQILLVDLSHCTAAELEKISRLVPSYVSTQPRGSILLLVDFTGVAFDRSGITRLKEATVLDRLFEAVRVGRNGKPAQGVLRAHEDLLP